MSKKVITIVASKETFENLSSFPYIEELNKAVRCHKDKLNGALNNTLVKF